MELIVVGFHRSGTSLLTQLLHAAGLFVGDDLLGALPSNPYGHFEDREVLEIHRAIMDYGGMNWQADTPQAFYISPARWREMEDLIGRRRAQHANWGFKEPRVCLFLGAWKYLLPEARFVVIYRDPTECVRSTESRAFQEAQTAPSGSGKFENQMRFFREPDHALKLWDVYNRAVVAFAEKHLDDCLVLPYSHLPDGYPVVRAINERFGMALDDIPTSAVFDPAVAGRSDKSQWVHDPEVERRVVETWENLEKLAARTEPSA